MENTTSNITNGNSDISSLQKPQYLMKQIVNDIESGKISVEEAMIKYRVKKRETIRTWITRFAADKNVGIAKRQHPVSIRRQAALEIEAEVLTVQEACRKYNASPGTIADWRKKYSCETLTKPSQEKMETIIKSTTDEGQRQEQIIQELKLKIYALETMIDLAEEEFNINIRKKCGTKQ